MALERSTRIGPYEVVEQIGAGGMGEVYRARDLSLERDVALKVLPDLFAADRERLARFEREARTLAALNHPNVAHVYGFEHATLADGSTVHVLAMEFVEGEDLAQRVSRGPVPVDEAIAIGRQVAEALEAAHEQGIVHRDLKPANVKVRPDGTVKVLDFGLAKAMDQASGVGSQAGAGALTNSPTITSPAAMTRAGVILGTAAYMAPEQARGRAVDRRADIWAFGCVLFEMLTGCQPFPGESITDVLAAVVKEEPEWAALPAETPAWLRRLLVRCLDKDPRHRLRDIGEARLVLAEPPPETEPARTEHGSVPAHAQRRTPWLWLAALGVVPFAAFLLGRALPPRSEPVPLRKFEIAVEGLKPDFVASAAISPDGAYVAYIAENRLWIRDLRELVPRRVDDATDVGTPPFWSPDSVFVGYEAGGKIWKVPVAGGSPTAVCDVPDTKSIIGASWGADDTIAFAAWRGALYSVAGRGGEPKRILDIDPATEIDFHGVRHLPDGRQLIVVPHWKQSRAPTIERLAGSERTVVLTFDETVSEVLSPVVTASGHLLYARTGSNSGVWAVPYDSGSGKPTGEPFVVVSKEGQVDVARDGTMIYVAANQSNSAGELVWVDRSGRVEKTPVSGRAGLSDLALSPDGTRVTALAQEGDDLDVWVFDLLRGGANRLTFTTDPERDPEWSPEGDRLFFATEEVGGDIKVIPADGSAEPVSVTAGFTPSLSRDGRYLAFSVDERGRRALRYAAIASDGSVGRPVSLGPQVGSASIDQGRISPDGRLLAYVADESGRQEVFLTRFPEGRGRWQVSVGGGRAPRWARGTGELFYVAGSGAQGRRDVTAVDVRTEPEVTVGTAQTVIDLRTFGAGSRSWDVSPDGRRILIVRPMTSLRGAPGNAAETVPGGIPRITVIQNWLAELQSPR